VRQKTLSLLLAIWMISLAFVSLSANVRAADNYRNDWTTIDLNSNNYPGGISSSWYAPGDAISGTLTGHGTADTKEDKLDVVAADDDPATGMCDAFVFADVRMQVNDVVLDPNTGIGTFSFAGSLTQYLSDGNYCAWVAPGDYIENAGAVAPYVDNFQFKIHLYRISASTDKGGYIPGNTVKIFYSVSKIKDGSLVTESAFTGNWLVQSTDGLTYWYGTLPGPTGHFDYTIINNGGVNSGGIFYPTWLWYNGTSGGAKREANFYSNVPVDNLHVNINSISPTTNPPIGTVMTVDIRTYVDLWFQPSYAGARVEVSILNGFGPSSPQLGNYKTTFYSDSAGQVQYIFIVKSADFTAGNRYTILVNATSVLKTDTDWATFDVMSVRENIAVKMSFDRPSYFSNDTATITVAAQPPSGHSQPNTYVYSVMSGSTLFEMKQDVSSTFTFRFPGDFRGNMDFRVDVYNAEGDYGSDSRSVGVEFGLMIVNVNPQLYNANDVITANFELKSTVMGASSQFFYKVCDSSCNCGTVVSQGALATTGLTGSFTFPAPNVPANSYVFQVSATSSGHVVVGSATATLVGGFMMNIEFDKKTYDSGETMTITYTITPRSAGTPLPRAFGLTWGIFGYPSQSRITTESSGTVQYVISQGVNKGNLLFQMSDSSTNAQAAEVVFIGAPPAEIGGIPLFDLFLLVLIVILFLLMLAMRGRGAGAGAPPKVKEEKAAPPPPPSQQASPMVVNCKSCGAPIEITTSKRPIEVMCPSCGETAMVQ